MLIPKIETERLLLRMYSADELETVYSMITDADVRKFLPAKTPPSKEDILASLPIRLDFWTARGFGQLGVFEKDTGKLTGYVGIAPLDQTPEIEIYYGFFKQFWGKGYATEAAKALLRFGFEEARLEKIVGAAHPENFPSQNVLKKIGLKQEKQLRHLYGIDSVYFSLLRADYRPDGAAKYNLNFTEIDD
ncbi:MAG TPA: GNAT family N-acetyltransferase [Pyrinomonadaceae bacterium]|jgi:ribosomal-protein-alanine N-acetyltransferase